MKKIIVPTDFSDCAFNALRTASVLARQIDAEIHLVHAYEKPLSGLSLQVEVDLAALRQLRSYIDEEIDRMLQSEFLVGLNVIKHVEADRKPWEILNLDPYIGMDLIVMGSHGSSGVKETFIGSNTQRFVQHSELPVLVVKESHDPREFKDILFASNFFGESDTAFEKVRDWINMFDAKVHLLKVITPANFERSEYSQTIMEDFGDKHGLENYDCHIYNDISLEKGIFSFARANKTDMLLVGTHGRKGLSHLILGSLAEQLVNHAAMPVMTMKIDSIKSSDKVLFPS